MQTSANFSASNSTHLSASVHSHDLAMSMMSKLNEDELHNDAKEDEAGSVMNCC